MHTDAQSHTLSLGRQWVSWFLTARQHKHAIHVGSRWKIQDRKQIKNRHYENQNTTQKKHATQNTAERHWPSWVASYDTHQGNEVGLLYSTPRPTQKTVTGLQTCLTKTYTLDTQLHTSQTHVHISQCSLICKKCKKRSLSHQLTAQLHIENSKNKKMVITLLQHIA